MQHDESMVTTDISLGGNLEEVPEPHIRRWPGYPRKRRVTVNLQSWRQTGVGSHYYVTITEEDNPIWDSRPYMNPDYKPVNGWRVCWDDDEAKGKHFLARFDTITEAKKFVYKTIKDHFPESDYQVENHYASLQNFVFQYRREGD